MLKPSARAMKKVAYLISNQVAHHMFFSNFLGFDYSCYELDSTEVEVDAFKHFLMDLLIINENDLDTSIYSLLRNLRNTQDLSAIPIIVITRKLKKTYHKKLKTSGATAVLIEPLDTDEAKKALAQSLRFHQVVEKTAHVQKPEFSNETKELFLHQSVIDISTIESINLTFKKDEPQSFVMGQILMFDKQNPTTQEILDIQQIIGQSVNMKTLVFLSSTELFFSCPLSLKETKSICQNIKKALSSKKLGICFGISSKTQSCEPQEIKTYLLTAKECLKQALKHPNSVETT